MRADEQAALGRDHYLRVHSSINRRWHTGGLLGQWNSDSQETLINLRLRYIPRPGADAYLVLNQALDKEGFLGHERSRETGLALRFVI